MRTPVRPSVLFIFGTRPEAIKLCPVVRYMRANTNMDVRVCVTAQHREMLDQVLSVFGITPDYDLAIMRQGQNLSEVTTRTLDGLWPVFQELRPAVAVVQGDTTTTFCGALAAFYSRVQVAHIEAGLRTGDPAEPFPEEMNRQLVGRLAAVHFAATARAAHNLIAEGIQPNAIHITGNTGIDAVLHVAAGLDSGAVATTRRAFDGRTDRKLIVVTAHRRETFGDGFQRICTALATLADREDVRIIYPVHPNPNVSTPVREKLGNHPNVSLLNPLDYVSFVDLMRQAWLILTDSGGIQEEAPSLGKPVLVMRDKTERPEAVEAGTAVLVGTSIERIVGEVTTLLNDPAEYDRRSRIHSPYGDGNASQRISKVLTERYSGADEKTAANG